MVFKKGKDNPRYGKMPVIPFKKGNSLGVVNKGRNAYWMKGDNNPRSGKIPVKPFTKGNTFWKANIGRKATPETLINLSTSHVGQTPWNKNKKVPQIQGNKHWNWQNGKSFEEYPEEFKLIKPLIRQRDNFRCRECFRHEDELFRNTINGIKKEKLSIHHIDYNKKNNDPDNLISLCRSCHMQTNFGRQDWESYFKGVMLNG